MATEITIRRRVDGFIFWFPFEKKVCFDGKRTSDLDPKTDELLNFVVRKI